jgi:CelD/BcsL family acetyltransferase involved in cellulose biosynthesis
MRAGTTLWLICVALIFAKVSGLHLHASACADSCDHDRYMVADHGLLLGNLHDDGEHQFIDLDDAEVLLVKLKPADGGEALGLPFDIESRMAVPVAAPLSARGPPSVAALARAVLPPTRAPPNSPA